MAYFLSINIPIVITISTDKYKNLISKKLYTIDKNNIESI